MKAKLIFLVLIILGRISNAQTTNTVSSGNWSETTVWSNGVPNGTLNVNVTSPVILDQNLTIGTGDYLFFHNVTDLPGGSAYSLNMSTSGGVLDIRAGTSTFSGNASFENATLIIRSGATLILGSTTFNNNNSITIEAGGTLIVNGTFNNSNSSGSFSLNGVVYVNGNYTTNNGNIDISGSGDIITTGTITTQGSSDVFGSTQDCNTGPCSGRNLCSYSNTITPSSMQVLCNGTTPTSLDGSAIAGPPTYTWESSTTSATTGFSTIVATTENYSPPASAATTWYRRKVDNGSCIGITPPVEIRVLPAGGWNGATSSNWNTASNWCNNTVPTSSTDVTISSGVPNQPIIGSAASCRDLIINSGATVTLNASQSFSIYGDLTNNGSFTLNSSSTVLLSGSTQQTVSGLGIDFSNLTINNTAAASPQVTINTFITVQNTLNMTAGNVNLSAYNLTLGTNGGSTGTLTYAAGHIYNGDFTRWMPASVIANGSNIGLFPMGSSDHDRPLYVSYPSIAPNPAGRMRVNHTGATTSTTGLNISDPPGTIQTRQDSYWTISTNGLSGGTYNLMAGGTGFGIIQEVADLRLMTAAGVLGAVGTNGGTTANPQVNRTGLTLANLSTSFYIGSVDPVNTPLPVTLLTFTGSVGLQGIDVQWTTAMEKNFNYFSLEHSTDGLHFNEIYQVKRQGGDNIRSDYRYLHETPIAGKNYYRLKSVDLDESYEYSNLIMIKYEAGRYFTVYPNPSSASHIRYQANFEIGASDYISIVNHLGAQVARGIPDISHQRIAFTQDLNPGVYLLQYKSSNFSAIIRVIVE